MQHGSKNSQDKSGWKMWLLMGACCASIMAIVVFGAFGAFGLFFHH